MVLLYIWLVLVFGNVSGIVVFGEGVWGSLMVKLVGCSGGEFGVLLGELV